MASLNMEGPYEFDTETITAHVDDKKFGNYALGYVRKSDGKFVVQYVGRTFNGVQARLLQHIYDGDNYEKFKFSYAKSEKEAYEKECRNYHDFGGDEGELYNKIHPAKPEDTNYKCPVCDE